MPETLADHVSISEAARRIGVNKSTLARQLKGGAVPTCDGKVSFSAVLAFRADAIDLTRSHRGTGRIDNLDAPPPAEPRRAVDATPDATIGSADATIPADATPDDADGDGDGDGGPIMVDGVALPYADARALKETYLAWLKKLEFETKRGELAPVGAMSAFVEREYGTVRERLLAIPGKLSGELDADQVERLTAELHEALEELHAEGAAAEAVGAARGEAEGDDDDA